jgi:pheromone shutdown-related protein TraB
LRLVIRTFEIAYEFIRLAPRRPIAVPCSFFEPPGSIAVSVFSAPPAPTHRVRIGGTEVTLLGTAHVSRQSVEDVRAALASENYDAVAVELCQPRYQHLTGDHDWRELDLLQVIRSGRAGLVAAQLALSAYQKRLADQLGVEPGGEMRAAIDGAQAKGLPLWLIDRNIGITMKRLVRSVPWYQRSLLFTGILGTFLTRGRIEEQEIERLKEGDLLESSLTEFAEKSPRLYRTLIEERDRYMAARLRERVTESRPQRVLAVVGAGHLKGLSERLAENSDPAAECQALETVPPPGRFIHILPWLIVAIILAGFAIGFARGPELGWRLVAEWVLINGTLTAIGAVLARAHPLTIVTAFFASPLTSLNPTIGAGMVTAAVQTVLRPPHMSDFDTVREAITTLRGWWANRVARILLVFVLCTVGSASATYIAGFRIFQHLAG